MSNLSQILADSNWGQESARINQNFQNLNADLEKVKSATTKFKGYFTSETGLRSKYPSPQVGDTAWVGETYPGTVYDVQVAGSWHNTGKAPDTGSVDLQDYAKKAELTELEEKIEGIGEVDLSGLENKTSSIGYVTCDTAAGTAAKVVTVTGLTALSTGIRLLVKMTNNNTASNATLNINSLGAKPLYYNNTRVSGDNAWEAGEVIDLYYDGTNFYSGNFQGGSGEGGNLTLVWNTDAATTRKQVKQSDRKSLLQISYKDSNGNPINEQYIGTTYTDTEWVKDSNWEQIASKSDISTILDDSRKYEYVGVKEFSEQRSNNNPTKEYFYYSKTGYNIKKIRVDANTYPCEYDLYIKDSQEEKYEHITQPDSNFVDVDIEITAGSQFTIKNPSTIISYTFVTGGWAYDLQMYLASNDSLDNLWMDTLTKKNYKKFISLDSFKTLDDLGDTDFSNGTDLSSSALFNTSNRVFPISVKNSGFIEELEFPYEITEGTTINVLISSEFSLLSDINSGSIGRIVSFNAKTTSVKQECFISIKSGEYFGVSYSSKGKYLNNNQVDGFGVNKDGWHIMFKARIIPYLTYLDYFFDENPITEQNYSDIIALENLKFQEIYGTKDLSGGNSTTATTINKDTSYSPYSAPNSGYITKITVAQPFSKEVNVQIYISDKGGKLTTGGSEIDMDKVAAKYTVKSVVGKADIDCSFKINKGQYIAIVYGDTGRFGNEGSYDGWGGSWYIYHKCFIVDAITYLESQKENTSSDNSNKLKPCSVYSDTFAFDKQVDYVDTDASPYEIKTKPAWNLSEGIEINREDVLNSYIPLRTANDKCRLQYVYTADYRTETWLVELLDKSSSINIGSEIDYGSAEGQSSFTINFATKQIGSQYLEFEPEVGKYYCISLEHTSFVVSVTITDTSDITKKSIHDFSGELKGFPFLQLVSGSINVRKLDISILGNDATLYITGDSIMMNKAVPNIKDRWAYKLRDDIGDVVISGRGTSAYKEVLYRVCSEIQFLKPRIVLDQNFVNGSDNKYIDFMIKWCKENGIKYIHTMPFPSRYSKNGGSYIIQHCDTIRTDLATALGGILDNGDDTSLLESDKIHLNTAGSIAVYNRIKLEYPNW